MDLTLFELHLEEGTFTANAPFSGDRPNDGEAPGDSEPFDDSGDDEGESGGGRGKLSVLLALLVLAGLAAAAYRLVSDEPEVDVDVS